ncbi:hypothetical protein A6A29_38795 [Streptomyces sp. TSRI0281]|nr:hypothetical protein A6A29_38795 [Streptomyces sp. TSRI0281]
MYSPTLIPGLLQAEGYAAALLSSIGRFRGIPVNDGAEAGAARVDRSHIIREPGRRFVFLIEEAALTYRVGDADAMAAQLGYLLSAGALPSVSLGVVPSSVSRDQGMWPQEIFHVYDDNVVSVELLSAQVNITQPSEVEMYVRAFEQLRGMAVYGAAARALVVKAIEALA